MVAAMRAAITLVLVLVPALGGCAPPVTASSPGAPASGCDVHWSYHGDTGPEHWGSLSPCYAKCEKGKSQSPIALESAAPSPLPGVSFAYKPSAVVLVNNGHTLQARFTADNTMRVDDTDYHLVELHFHHPAEHTREGQPAVMEMHLVHADARGELAVVGVRMVVSKTANPALAPLWQWFPGLEEGQSRTLPAPFDVMALLPERRGSFRYPGSLTAPPCTEGVRWWVLEETIPVSEEQVAAFVAHYPDNHRPVQDRSGRNLLEPPR